MALAFGVTQDTNSQVEWFDTFKEARDCHQKKSPKWNYVILVYGFATHICTFIYHPSHGYFPTGFVDGDVDLMQKYGVYDALESERAGE